MTRRTRSVLFTLYQSTSRVWTRRSRVAPRTSTATLFQARWGRVSLSCVGVGSRSPLVRGRPRRPVPAYPEPRSPPGCVATRPCSNHRRRAPPRTRGDRLPTPTQLSDTLPQRAWNKVAVDVRGATRDRLVHTRDVLWYRVNKTDLVRLVIVRDPDGREPDDYFFTTDLHATGDQVASRYAARWAIEVL